MLKELRDVILDYSIIGGTMAILTALIKPFICWKKTIRDSAISFLFSMLCGLLLEYWDIPYAVKVGLSGTVGLFAVRIYAILESLLKKVEENPEQIIDKIKHDN